MNSSTRSTKLIRFYTYIRTFYEHAGDDALNEGRGATTTRRQPIKLKAKKKETIEACDLHVLSLLK